MSDKATFTTNQITYHIIDNQTTMIIQIEKDGEVCAEKELNIDQIKLTSGYFAKYTTLNVILENFLTLATEEKITCEPREDKGYDFILNINSKFTKMITITIPKKDKETTEQMIARRIGKTLLNNFEKVSTEHIPAGKRLSVGLDSNTFQALINSYKESEKSTSTSNNHPKEQRKKSTMEELKNQRKQSEPDAISVNETSSSIASTTIIEKNEKNTKIIEEQAQKIKSLQKMIKTLKENFSNRFGATEKLFKQQTTLIEETNVKLNDLEDLNDKNQEEVVDKMNAHLYEFRSKQQICIEDLREKSDIIIQKTTNQEKSQQLEPLINTKKAAFDVLSLATIDTFSFYHKKPEEQPKEEEVNPIITIGKSEPAELSSSSILSFSISKSKYRTREKIGSLTDDQTELISNWLYKGQPIQYNLLYTATKGKDTEAECIKSFYTKSPLLILIKGNNGSKFGGYTSVGWNIPSEKFYSKADPEAFLFSIDRRKQYLIKKEHSDNAIYCGKGDIATFNAALCLYENFMSSEANWSNLNYYECTNPDETDLTHEAEPFIVEELFAYQVIFN